MEFNILPLAEAETFYITFFNLFQTESEMERNCGYVCVVSFNLVCVSPVSVCFFSRKFHHYKLYSKRKIEHS